MKKLNEVDFKNKRVLVRCDFNVPLDEKGNILDDFRIKQSIPTIEYLIKKEAKVILMSHLGRPKGKVTNRLKMDKVQEKLTEHLDLSVAKAKDCVGKEVKEWTLRMKPGEVLLLENLRFYNEEEENEEGFGKQLAELADIYINDAFGICHRSHASIVGVPKHLPSYTGLLLRKEVKVLSMVLENPWRPMVVIIGGTKIATKIRLIEDFLERADHLILGGEIANAFLAIKGVLIGSPDSFGLEGITPEIEERIKKIELTNPKLHLPVDGMLSLKDLERGLHENYLRHAALGQVRSEEKVYDIGPETIKIFSEIIKGPEVSFWRGPLEYIKKVKAPKTILWNGPLGMFENKKFEKGSKEIADAIVKNHSAFKIIGGGDTIPVLKQFGIIDKIDHVSTGGGAMLEFLAGEKLPGIEVLKNGN